MASPTPALPWFHETTSPHLLNEWSWTHLAWGVAAGVALRDWRAALLIHTIYEALEGYVFPREHRDVSMRNHVGDSLAFIAGWALGHKEQHERRR